MDKRSHWETVYRTRKPTEVSWYRPHLDVSLSLIEAAAERSADIIDVGGGASTLADDLLQHGYRHISVLDISAAALLVTKSRLGESAGRIEWLCGDVTTVSLPQRQYDVWHDRAVFHFLTQSEDRAAYVRQVRHSVKPSGHVIVATFGPEGPARCSGLDIVRYGAGELHREFGDGFRLEQHLTELHRTPGGGIQQFTYCHLRLEAA